MLSLLISLFGKRARVALAKFLPYFLVVFSVVALLWWIDRNGFNRGVDVTEQKYQTAIQEERYRQIEANNAALEEARRRQAELERLLDERDAEIAEILDEAGQDPDADRRAIGTGSVFRLNRIR